MVKVKCGAIVKNISDGALNWYKLAGWKVLEEKKSKKKEIKEVEDDKTDSEEIIAS